jgi:hypothetical protein
MYHDHEATYRWYRIKRDVAEYVALCDTCQRVKTKHQRPAGCCNPCKYLSGSRKKLLWISSWDCIGPSLNMISLWAIVDRLAKVAHIILIKMTCTGPQLAELYSYRIVYFHEVPMRIVFDRETQVILKFWESSLQTMATHLNFSFAYHPQTDGQPRE